MASFLSTATAPILLTDRKLAIETLLSVVRSHQRFLVTSHARPDGDAVGSVLATLHLLEAMGKEAIAVMADPVPATFQALPGTERIARVQPSTPAEIAIVLECDSIARTGYPQLAAEWTMNIDHHQSGVAFATVNWIDPQAPAVGAMLYELAIASGIAISPALASCLYTAILTDTVHFTSQSTTAETFALAEHLVNLGADAGSIAEAVYHSCRPARLWVLGAALRRFRMVGPVAWSAITHGEITEAGAETEDCEGIVNYVVGVKGVRAGVFLRELPNGSFRASLRSKGALDVAVIAEGLGGGGHRNASGCTLEGPLERAVERVMTSLQAACAEAGWP